MIDEELFNELFEERASIMEYDGKMTREQAEINAYKDVLEILNNKNKQVKTND